MPDTVRTQAELLAMYADNTTGAISEQDGRDLIKSATLAAGTEIEIVSNTLTITDNHHIVRGEGGNDDTVETIVGGIDGQWLVLEAGAGRIQFDAPQLVTAWSQSVILDDTISEGYILAFYSAAISKWIAFNPGLANVLRANNQSSRPDLTVVEGEFRFVGGINYRPGDFTIAGDRVGTGADCMPIMRVAPESGSSDNIVSINTLSALASPTFFYLHADGPGTTITLKNNDAGGEAGWKLFTYTGADIALTDAQFATFIKNDALDGGLGGWMVR